jgi:glycosyltransferase involved in cell wall biosynthesis
VIAVGNLKPHKNIPRLLEAMRQLPAGCPTIDLVIAGQSDGFFNADPDIARAARALENRVHFTGRISDREVRRYVHHAQALVFPSLYEGFGLPPLEAMAAGTAVISATIQAVQEVCGDAVRYVDAMDPKAIAVAIAEVISMPDVRSQLIKQGRDRARLLTWKVAAQATWQSLSSLA